MIFLQLLIWLPRLSGRKEIFLTKSKIIMKTRFYTIIFFATILLSAFSAKGESPRRISLPDCSALDLVKAAFEKVEDNFPAENYLMEAFYRENISREGYSISFNEAILGIGKSSYKNSASDRVAVRKARTTMPFLSGGDSVMVKLQGGPYSALMTDLVKKSLPGSGKDCCDLNDKYMFWYGDTEYLNGSPFITVIFDQRYPEEELLCRGKIFIEPESYAIGRIEFNLNVENRKDSYQTFVKSKPSSMRIDVKRASYTVNYKKFIDKWYMSSSESEVDLYVKWNKKSIDNNYTLKSQLAVVDFIAGDISSEKDKVLKQSQFLSEFANSDSSAKDWEMLNMTLNRLFAQKSSSPETNLLVN